MSWYKVRHHLRRFDDGRAARRIRDSVDSTLDALARGSGPRDELIERLRRCNDSASHQRALLDRMTRAGGNITANLRAALRWMPDGIGPLGDDRHLADSLSERLAQEITALDAALPPVREVLAAAGTSPSATVAAAGQGHRRVVLVTSSDDVYGALRASLEGPFALREVRGTLYETGVLPTEQGPWEVALVRIEPGTASAGLELDRAGTALGPEAVVFVGLGTGLDRVRPGDVVIAESVIDYQSAKETEQGTLPQGRTHRAGYRMIQYARHLARSERWTGLPSDADAPQAFLGLVATGPTIVGDNSSRTAGMLAQHAHDALLVDTEGHGFLQGAYLNPRLDVLVVHGAAHRVGQIDESPRASRSAAEFTLDFLARLPRTPPDAS